MRKRIPEPEIEKPLGPCKIRIIKTQRRVTYRWAVRVNERTVWEGFEPTKKIADEKARYFAEAEFRAYRASPRIRRVVLIKRKAEK